MPKFIVQHGYRERSEFVLPEGPTRIGRSPEDNDLVLTGNGVSRRHALAIRREDTVTLQDLGSSNGSFLNSQRVVGSVPIKHKDVIQLGEVILIYDEVENDTLGAQRETEPITSLPELQSMMALVRDNIQKVIRGKEEVVRNVLIGLLSDGHVLIEDVPGVGKTMLCQALAKSIRAEFKRIQFTPDMLPSDITGVTVYDDHARQFNFTPGPIFANVILADEINRGTPRTQSSLLECMSEAVVTVDGQTHVLPKPFFVIATQNPVDFHGTYPLPEPQLDRFLMRLRMGYPSNAAEREILSSQVARHPINDISYVLRANDILQCQALVRTVHVSEPVMDYVITLIDATRKHPAFAFGCSPRAAVALMRGSQSLAALNGRPFVLPRDVRDLAVSVLSHRMPLKMQARAEWESAEQVVATLLEQHPIAKWETA